MHKDIKKVLFSGEEIHQKCVELAKQIDHDYAKCDSIFTIGLLKGSIPFMAELCKCIQTPLTMNYMRVSSYTGSESGELKMVMDLDQSVEGKDVLIVDDMIASGESVLDIALELKKRNAKNVYVATTFAFFTEGLEKFNKYYSDGIISKVYSTNLTYISPELRETKWFNAVDMSEFLSRVINRLNYGKSIAKYMDATRIIRSLLK